MISSNRHQVIHSLFLTHSHSIFISFSRIYSQLNKLLIAMMVCFARPIEERRRKKNKKKRAFQAKSILRFLAPEKNEHFMENMEQRRRKRRRRRRRRRIPRKIRKKSANAKIVARHAKPTHTFILRLRF